MNWLPRGTTIVPIDFSDDSFAAIGAAREMVDDPDHLRLVHVLPTLEPADPGVIWSTVDDAGRSRHAEGALQKELQDRGLGTAQIVIRFGDPGHEIAAFANQTDAQLVVISSHGKSALQHLLIGSVAGRVVRLARCPVRGLKKGS